MALFFETANMPNYQTLKDWGDKLQTSVILGVKIFIVILFLVLLPHMIMELFRSYLIIKPFEVPLQLAEEQGYSGNVVAYRLQGYMDQKRDELERSSMQGVHQGVAAVQSAELARQQAIDVPTLGFSLSTIISQIRWLLGFQQDEVNGDIVIRDDQLHLNIRITGQLPTIFSDDDVTNPEEVIKQAAEYVLKTVEPLLLGNNYCLNQKDDLLAKLIDEIQQSQMSQKEQAIALMLESCLLKNQGEYKKALEKLDKAQQRDPTNPLIFLMKGNTLLESDEPYRAIVAYKMALAYAPNNGGIYTKLAQAFLRIQQPKRASAQYLRASKKDPHNPWIYTNWGEQYADMAKSDAETAKVNFDKAVEKFKQALQVDPSYALAYGAWGNALFQKKDYLAASEKYEKAVKLEPTIAWFYGNWGVTLTRLRKREKALEKFEQSLKLRQTNWVYKTLVKELKRLEKPELFEKYQKVVLTLKQGVYYYYESWGNVLVGLGQYNEALVKYQKALEIKPQTKFYNKLLDTLQKLNKPDSFAQYESLIEKRNQNNLKRRYYYAYGRTLVTQGEYEQAITQYKKALEAEPTYLWGRVWLGYALIKVQKQKEALTQCREILISTSSVSDTIQARAQAICGLAQLGINQPEKAVKSCRTALTLSEIDWAYWCLGDVLVLQDKPDEAMMQYKAAVTLEPENAFYYNKWGQTLVELKQYEAALMQYRKAVELDKVGDIGEQAQAGIDALKEAESKL